jgi:hypothetical protein
MTLSKAIGATLGLAVVLALGGLVVYVAFVQHPQQIEVLNYG